MFEDISILVVDDHLISGLGTKAMLNSLQQTIKVFTSNNLEEIKSILKDNKIDVVFLDVVMPEIDSFEILKEIKREYPEVKVLMLTISEEKSHIYKSIKYAADGYIFKDINSEDLYYYLKLTLSGKKSYHSRVIELFSNDIISSFESASHTSHKPVKNNLQYHQKFDKLTKKEKLIISYIAKGLSTKEIAKKLNLSQYTINTHRKNIHSKLELVNHSSLSNIAKEFVENN